MKTSLANVQPSAAPRPSAIEQRRSTLATESTGAPLWEPATPASGGTPTSDQVLHVCASLEVREALAARFEDIINRPLRADESHKIGNDNKESDIRALLRLLTPLEALALRKRLHADRPTDRIVVAFRRLTVERRTRLVAYLGDPRRTVK